ncbi:MAG: acetylglutamate kinase [Clostridia bacterium]|nr:acetylglutamate kinase [Clostridia bacterium]
MNDVISKASILTEALPYIKKFSGITVVIKYGGAALVNEDIKSTIIKDIALMKYVGFKPVVVHGGGKDINKALEAVGIEPKFKDGLRVTDEPTMEIVQQVLAGKINKNLTTELCLHGINAVGICGKDAGFMQVKKAMPKGMDIGLVGDVTEVKTDLINTLIDNDFVPVISSIGVDEEGNSYNVNADYAAVAVAGALKAEKLVFVTDVAGIMRDVNDPGSVISVIKEDEVNALIEDGTISGGMLPKVQCCMAGVEAGVNNVHILDGRIAHCLILEIFTNKGIGTLIEK